MGFSEEFVTHKRRGTSYLGPASAAVFHAGDVSWTPSADHATLTRYDIYIRASGSGTILLTINAGKPPIWSSTGLCYKNISGSLSSLSAGNYTSAVAAVSAGGTTESATSNEFSLPLF